MQADGSIACDINGTNIPPKIQIIEKNMFSALENIKEGDKVPKFDINNKVFPGKCIDVYDGDTIHVAILYNGVVNDFVIRMYGYNSAELRTKNAEEKEKGVAAKNYISELVLNKNVVVHMMGHDKYGGRWLGNVYLLNKSRTGFKLGDCVNALMVKGGHGAEYFGAGEKKY